MSAADPVVVGAIVVFPFAALAGCEVSDRLAGIRRVPVGDVVVGRVYRTGPAYGRRVRVLAVAPSSSGTCVSLTLVDLDSGERAAVLYHAGASLRRVVFHVERRRPPRIVGGGLR